VDKFFATKQFFSPRPSFVIGKLLSTHTKQQAIGRHGGARPLHSLHPDA
jgi:hypothetical protein